MMTAIILVAVCLGIVFGQWTHGTLTVPPQIDFGLFAVMLLGIGIQIGEDQQLWQRIRAVGLAGILLPLQIAFGTIIGAIVAALVMKWPLPITAAIGAGSGWYSLTAILLNQLSGPRAGAMGFLANVMRELLSFLLIPVVARFMRGRVAIAFGGSTTMDTTLAVIVKYSSADTALLAFSSGVVLSTLVPLMVPSVYHLL